MIEIGVWCLAAVFLGIVCVLFWFFLKLFFRLALFLIAITFLMVFLYQYSLLPEPLDRYAEGMLLDIKTKLQETGWINK